ncbi:uncharacterized protein LOC106659970 [Trichogramma pretiosum]|uniref:uncharacterized protein LOC106659970 n=1 Tax=Trichogramma pretiosum TaxID=7493 RepID=UPI000C71C896|nr:uncharacterized protein LOC106659970 [Trichogramma pretiosum]
MNVDRESKMSHSLLAESKEEKRNRFVKIFIEQGNWMDEDVLAFINDEFDNNVEDINWIFKTTLESKPSFSNRIFDVAMKNGPELRVLNDLGQTAIHIAAIHKQTYVIYELSDYFGDKNLSDNEGLTYFHVACMYDLTDLVQKYIDQGVDINLTFYKNGRRVSPLSLCLEHGSPMTLRFLLNNGADLKLYDDWNSEPLSCLKRIKRNLDKDWDEWEILANHHFKELLKQTTDSEIIENRSDDEGFTYLHAACMSGSIEMVQKFIDQNNDLDLIWCLADGTKESPLTLATEFKRIEMVEMLLKNGANPNIKQLGKSPLHVFLKVFTDYDRDSNLLDLFISYNCDVNEKDNNGCSPLFLCFENCIEEHCDEVGCEFHKLFINRKNLETLLKNKADISEVFANGQSILHLFISSEICRVCQIDFKSGPVRNRVGIELIKTLLKYGANVNAKDNNGDSPLHLAVLSCNLEVVEVLLAHGADVQSFDFSKLCWEYDWSISWLHKIIKFFLILHCLNDNGCIMDELSCLTVSKFLVNEINHSELCNEWERKIFVGSTNQIRSLLTSIKNRRGGDKLDEYDKADLAHLIYQQLQTIEKANMFSTAEMKDCLQQLQKSYMLEEEVICGIDTEISTEIENIKKLEIKDGLSLLDVCASSPGKAYYLLKNSNFWAVIDSRKFEDDFEEISDTIRGYIIKCFMRKFLMDFGLKYLTLLTQGKLPILCCEHLIQYLNYDDILNLCEAYVNKK